jgi:hypothetical protein
MKKEDATNWTIGVVVVLIVLIIGLWYYRVWRKGDRFTLDRTKEVRASADGLRYRVHTVHKNPDAAAETMAELNRRSIELMRHLRDKYLRGPLAGKSPARDRAITRLLGLYNPDNLAENSPRDPEGDTSYTIDKGAILALCLREKNPARNGDANADAEHHIHDLETLTFVTLHELTHIAVEDLDHPPRFWQAFKFILEEATEAGLLRGVDYERRPTVYCGMDIDYSPLFDRSLQALT